MSDKLLRNVVVVVLLTLSGVVTVLAADQVLRLWTYR